MVSFLFIIILAIGANAQIGLQIVTDPPTTNAPTLNKSKLPITPQPTPRNPTKPTREPTILQTPQPTPYGGPPTTETPTTPEPTQYVPPTSPPTKRPTDAPTNEPSLNPTDKPTSAPTNPTTIQPTKNPSVSPTFEPTIPSETCCSCLSVQQSDVAGCSADKICETNVCKPDAWCCQIYWDRLCVAAATNICSSQTKLPSVSPTASPVNPCCSCTNELYESGCRNDAICESNVCRVDPFCCDNQWDIACAKAANRTCTSNTFLPTKSPTIPTVSPSLLPTTPTYIPTIDPTINPTVPTLKPTKTPPPKPTTASPTYHGQPTKDPIGATTFRVPTRAPVCISYPGLPKDCETGLEIITTAKPTPRPTKRPTPNPTPPPTPSPTTTSTPTTNPSLAPSFSPTTKPTDSPHTPGTPSRGIHV